MISREVHSAVFLPFYCHSPCHNPALFFANSTELFFVSSYLSYDTITRAFQFRANQSKIEKSRIETRLKSLRDAFIVWLETASVTGSGKSIQSRELRAE